MPIRNDTIMIMKKLTAEPSYGSKPHGTRFLLVTEKYMRLLFQGFKFTSAKKALADLA